MSDVSEHDSDSDAEKESSSSTAKKEDTTKGRTMLIAWINWLL